MADHPSPYYQYYKDHAGEYRWVYRAANHEHIGKSSEGYKNKEDCLYGIALMKASTHSPVYETTLS